MLKTLTALALTTAIALPSASLAASDDVGYNQSVADQVRTMLTEQGYEVRKIDFEDGLYEAYALKNGERMEVYVNAALEIVRHEGEEDDD